MRFFASTKCVPTLSLSRRNSITRLYAVSRKRTRHSLSNWQRCKGRWRQWRVISCLRSTLFLHRKSYALYFHLYRCLRVQANYNNEAAIRSLAIPKRLSFSTWVSECPCNGFPRRPPPHPTPRQMPRRFFSCCSLDSPRVPYGSHCVEGQADKS